MTAEQMKQRTKSFAVTIVKECRHLPDTSIARTMGSQLLRSGTSVGANYRAACRAKSTPDFIHKLSIVEEECDESMFWMEIMEEAQVVPTATFGKIHAEAHEILAITVASINTAKSKRHT
jgi:four helix bundle protein